MSEGEPNESGAAAKLGTAAHALGERCLNEDFADPSKYLGYYIDVHDKFYTAEEYHSARATPLPEAFEVDDNMVDAVRVYVDVVQGHVERLPTAVLSVEKKFDLSWLRPEMFGTNDASVYQFMGELVVIDYKHGQGVFVPISEPGPLIDQKGRTIFEEHVPNSQLMYYGVGAAQTVDWLFETLTLVVVQPRCPSAAGGVRQITVTKAEVEAWRDYLGWRVDVVREADESYNDMTDEQDFMDWVNTYLDASEGACKWCKALVKANGQVCPAATNRSLSEAMSDFDDDPYEVGEFDDKKLKFTGTGDMKVPLDLTELGHALKWVSLIDLWTKAVKAAAQRLAEAGEEVPGWKLVRGKTNSQWNEDLGETDKERAEKLAAEFEAMTVEALMPPPEPQEPALLSVAQAEKLLKGRGSGVLKKKLRDDFSHKPDGKLALAHEDDPREAVAPLAQTDFADVED